MYTPDHFKINDSKVLASFLKKYNFGMLLSHHSGAGFNGTHLPFVVSFDNNHLRLETHVAISNSHAKLEDGDEVLIIFQGPHGYIDPMLYDKHPSVPTWNYTAVHVHGKVAMVQELIKKRRLLDRTIDFFDKEYLKVWKETDESYKNNMLKGIIGIEIVSQKVEATFKLSQNKSEKSRKNIMQQLLSAQKLCDQELGLFMNEFFKEDEK